MNWQEFPQQDPESAALGQERLERHGLVMVATLLKNGWPRISPVEPLFFNAQLYLGMMWRSQKALDLLRDPRCCVHNAVSDRMATDGEFKVYGRALDITNPEERQEYLKALFQKNRRPTGGARIPLLRHRHQERGGQRAGRRRIPTLDVESPLTRLLSRRDPRRQPPPPRPPAIPERLWPGT